MSILSYARNCVNRLADCKIEHRSTPIFMGVRAIRGRRSSFLITYSGCLKFFTRTVIDFGFEAAWHRKF